MHVLCWEGPRPGLRKYRSGMRTMKLLNELTVLRLELAVALVATLVAVLQNAHAALELDDGRVGHLQSILHHVASCARRVSAVTPNDVAGGHALSYSALAACSAAVRAARSATKACSRLRSLFCGR